MTLLNAFLEIVRGWRVVFPQERSYLRAVRQGMGSLVCLGRRTVSRIIWSNGGEQCNPSSEYFLHSRCRWDAQQLFRPILHKALPFCQGSAYIGVAADDTRLHKTGRSIRQAFYQRDPMSPPFHVNLILGLRFLQASLLVPLHRGGHVGARAVPVQFVDSPPLKRPGRKATAAEWAAYKRAARQHTLSHTFAGMMGKLRQELDDAGASAKTLLIAADGSFCNRTVLTAEVDRTEVVARTRKDAVLCFRAPAKSRRFYDGDKFTPDSVRQDEAIAWKTTKIFYGGKRRPVRYKELLETYWEGGARRRPLRLLVVAATPYKKRKSAKPYYRQPAYLLTTDLKASARTLLQFYFDRWQIEVNHREEKDTLGVGQAQLWNETSVPKQPALAVASYSALLLASLVAFGAERGAAYAVLPRWRKNAKRPSCLDLIALLRKEMIEHPELTAQLNVSATAAHLMAAAAA